MWHTIALALGGRTVAEWRGAMTDEEFEDWVAFYNLYPFDDFHRYQRPAALICQVYGGGGKDALQSNMEWLAMQSSSPADGMMAREEMNEYHRQFFTFAGTL